jgi:hypothetical protein
MIDTFLSMSSVDILLWSILLFGIYFITFKIFKWLK